MPFENERKIKNEVNYKAMTKEKMQRIVTALTVAATTFVTFLLGVILYQIITIGVLDRREKDLQKMISKAEQTIEEKQLDLEYYLSQEGLENAVYANGGKKQQDED